MAAVNFCVCALLPGLRCCFSANVSFSFKVSKAPCLRYYHLLLASRNPEMLRINIQTQPLFKTQPLFTNGSAEP